MIITESTPLLILQMGDLLQIQFETEGDDASDSSHNIVGLCTVDSESNTISEYELTDERIVRTDEGLELTLGSDVQVDHVKFKTDTTLFAKQVIHIPYSVMKCAAKMCSMLEKHIDQVVHHVSAQRVILKSISNMKFNVNVDFDAYRNAINQLIDVLNGSEVSDANFVAEIRRCMSMSSLTPEDASHYCMRALAQVIDSLILTGDYVNPGDSPDSPENPENAMITAVFPQTDLHHCLRSENCLNEEDLLGFRTFNVPTDKEYSPLHFHVAGVEYDARTPFQNKMLRFEELGSRDISDCSEGAGEGVGEEVGEEGTFYDSFPMPDESGNLNGDEVGNFISMVSDGSIGHMPSRQANVDTGNPWRNQIPELLRVDMGDFRGVAEGRSPGVNGEHITWTIVNAPRRVTVTGVTGARVNGGERNGVQRHGWTTGEWGDGGLYGDAEKVGTQGTRVRFHPGLPDQHRDILWTFDGTFPPKLLVAKYGEAHVMRNYNFLPVQPHKNRGFGIHTISTHEHNGPSASVSDGFAQSFFFPGEYYDYLFPMTVAGHTTVNTLSQVDKCAAPHDVKGKDNVKIPGDWKEIMSTHWFHDHMLDYTAQNVYKGNAAMMNYYSAIDRGNEEIDDGVNLRLPSGTGLAWGNRDYDVNLVIADKAWDNEGQLWFNPFNKDGFLGDRMTVNWCVDPYFDVRTRRYRFRILNAGVSRFMKYAIVHKRNDALGVFKGKADEHGMIHDSFDPVPFWLIGNDGNLMMHSIRFDGTNGTTAGILPVLAIAERFDIVVDFSKYAVGDRLYMVNVLEHKHGKRPNKEIDLASVLNCEYELNGEGRMDPCVRPFLEFRVHAYEGTDKSVDPSVYEVNRQYMIPIEPVRKDDIRNAVRRHFKFVQVNGDDWAIQTDGGEKFKMDPRRCSAAAEKNSIEIWELENGASTWAHNVHIHFTEGKVLLRDNQLPPIWEQFARKDVYRIGGKVDSSEKIVIALQFRDIPAGTYMMHCHNTQHEDHAMLLRWDIQEGSCVGSLPCPLPSWDGVKFMETKVLPTYRSGLSNDNIFNFNPFRLVDRLEEIDDMLPENKEELGQHFVNGLGKSLV